MLRIAASRIPSLGPLWRDSRGVAAIEFAYMAPLLLLLLLGTVEAGRAIDVNRHFAMATQAVGDLVAREQFLGTSESNATHNLESMMKSVEHMMQPYDPSELKLGIFQVRASPDEADDTYVEWTYTHNGMEGVPTKCQKYALPPGLLDKGGSVIVVESSYVFKPLFADFVPGFSPDMEWKEKSMHSPRNSCVDYVEGQNCSSTDC